MNCTIKIDELRDKIDKDTVNRDLWIGLVTILRENCHSLLRLEEAVLGDDNGNVGMYDMLTTMVQNQSKRSDDTFSWKRTFKEKILPTLITSILLSFIAAAVGWWVAVNELLHVVSK